MNIQNKFKLIFQSIFFPIFIYIVIQILLAYVLMPLNTMIITGIGAIFTIPVLILYSKTISKNFLTFSFKINKRLFVYILGISLSLNLIGNIFILITNIFQNDKIAIEVQNSINSINIYLSILITVFIVPLVEELIFRGYIYRGMYNISNFFIASIVSSLLFSIIHFNISQGIYAFLAGVVISYVYYLSNNFLICYIIHLIMNFFSFFLNVTVLNTKNQYFVLMISIVLLMMSLYSITKYYKEISK